MIGGVEELRRGAPADEAGRTGFRYGLPSSDQLRGLVETSASMLGSLLVTSGLGFVYWWIAARAFPEAAVGVAAAAVSAMWLFGTLGMLGFGTTLTRELPRYAGTELPIILAAVGITTAAGMMLGTGFALVTPFLDPELGVLGANLWVVALFALGVGLTASGEVLDLALIGALLPRLQFARNVAFAVVKLLAIGAVALWLTSATAIPIYASWVAGLLLSVGGVVAYLAYTSRHSATLRPAWRTVLHLGPSALGHHLLNLALLAPSWILPLIVTILVSAEANSAFFVASMFAGFAFYVPDALTYALFAAGSRERAALWRSVRVTLALSIVAAVLATLVVALIGPWLLEIYGESYRERGSVAVVVLTAAAIPLSIKAHYVAVQRVRGAIRVTSVVAICGSLFELIAAGAGAIGWGINGAAIGFAAAMSVEALLMAPSVIGAARRPARSPEAGGSVPPAVV